MIELLRSELALFCMVPRGSGLGDDDFFVRCRLFCLVIHLLHVQYLEISKPNLRNNLKQLFAMKNSILILCLLFTGVTFSQGLPRTQIFDAYDSRTDSIVVYKVSDDVYTNKLRIFRAPQNIQA